jgi:hypothetical protein
MGGGCGMYEKRRHVYRFLTGNSEVKRPSGRPRLSWEDGVRKDINEIGFEVVGWIDMAQNRDKMWAVVNVVRNLRFR